MNVYDELKDLYNFDEMEEYKPSLVKISYTIDNVLYNGHSFTTPSGLNVFTYRTKGAMGNHWKLYDIDNGKHLIFGEKTRKQIIKNAELL
ncbi:hypothetical protein PQ478_08720 [Alkalihalophilus pseudofirmus]|uniref:hypothetical protein n=1 Tax=Alkalihalophilus pseudofirmus TaxID=79885 RepID=UPI00259BC98B|nr:hypothetical protein [Alkalihalophilus pseudofirmus]WEG18552.1 hypothetical protein PQ478_08720 [Alkalihalophilus pseudofirmus]